MCVPFFTLIIDTFMLPGCHTPCQGGWTDLGAKAHEQHSKRGGVTRERGALKKNKKSIKNLQLPKKCDFFMKSNMLRIA